MSGNHREWMYKRYQNGLISQDFLDGIESFIKFALDRPEFLDGEKIKYPCRKCKNQQYHNQYTVRLHLGKSGFVPNYYNWIFQGERRAVEVNCEQNFDEGFGLNTYHEMIRDVGASQFRMNLEEPPNPVTGIATHFGGSRSAHEYAEALANEKNISDERVDWEVSLRIHSKNEDYTSARSKRIAERVYQLAHERSEL